MAEEEVSQYSVKPFIAYDGGDGHGGPPAEVLVSKGVGVVTTIEDQGRSSKIEVSVEGRKYNIGGYINSDDPAIEIAKESLKTGIPVQFRRETQRKSGKPRTLSMDELRGVDANNRKGSSETAKENVKNLMVGFGRVGEDLVLSGQHLTDPAKDASASSVPADSALAMTAEEEQKSARVSQGDIESRPWFGTNNDGSINAGSYAVNGAATMFFAVAERFPNADDADVARTASSLMEKVDIMQLAVYGYGKNSKGALKGRPNRFSSSHTLGRRIVQDVISEDSSKDVDISKAADISNKENANKWENRIASRALRIWKYAIEDYSGFLKTYSNKSR